MNEHLSLINMQKQQLRSSNVLNPTVLALYEEIPRVDFVPEESKPFAYADIQIPLANDQRMMTPTEEALLLQALNLQGHERVLEVGTGTGFLTALLSKQSAEVISVDYYAEFTQAAQQKLVEHNISNVTLKTGDAYNGWLESAPYDIMVFTGGLDALTDTHTLQVLPGGKLFALVGEAPVMQGRLYTLLEDNTWQMTVLFDTCLPPLISTLTSKPFNF